MSIIPYAAPTIGPDGLTVPSYQSILQDNVEAYLNIFGQNQVVDPSSAIYQLLSILSIKMSDVCQALQLAYNQSSPQTAVGAGLDRDVKMNGLARNPFTYSTCPVTLTGTAGTIVTNGFAQDVNGNLWAIPSPTTIVGGSVTVVATCTTPGAVVAEPGQISIVSSLVNGWTAVTNASAATPGDPVETDSQLRARQSISVALPSLTTLDSTIAAVLAVPGVVRVAPGYPTSGGPGTSIENPTGSIDSWGNPAHSVSIVADGGTDAAVAQAIYGARGIGPLTHGTTSVLVTDPQTGYQMTVSFYRPTNLPAFVNIVLVGYGNTPTTAQIAAVQTAVVNYLNSLAIGEQISIGALYFEVMNVNPNISNPPFGIQSLQVGTTVADSTTASTTNTSPTITVALATGIANGQLVIGAGIPPNTFVTGYTSGTSVTLTNNCTATASGVPVTFITVGTSDIAMPNFYYAAEGITANVEVSAS
jgi:uncharacterized phage protein gp47/JayE